MSTSFTSSFTCSYIIEAFKNNLKKKKRQGNLHFRHQTTMYVLSFINENVINQINVTELKVGSIFSLPHWYKQGRFVVCLLYRCVSLDKLYALWTAHKLSCTVKCSLACSVKLNTLSVMLAKTMYKRPEYNFHDFTIWQLMETHFLIHVKYDQSSWFQAHWVNDGAELCSLCHRKGISFQQRTQQGPGRDPAGMSLNPVTAQPAILDRYNWTMGRHHGK